MVHTRTWTVEVTISEDEEQRRTHAAAVLHTDSRTPGRSPIWPTSCST